MFSHQFNQTYAISNCLICCHDLAKQRQMSHKWSLDIFTTKLCHNIQYYSFVTIPQQRFIPKISNISTLTGDIFLSPFYPTPTIEIEQSEISAGETQF